MTKPTPMPPVFRLARESDGRKSFKCVAKASATPSTVSPPTGEPGRRRPGPRKTSQGGGGRFIARLIRTIQVLRRRIAHLERESERVIEAAGRRCEAATRTVVEQREAARVRTARQAADIDKRNAERSKVRVTCLGYEAERIDAVEALRRINEHLDLGVPGLERET